MKHHLLTPTAQRRGRLMLTLVASLAFHGSLIGVAALWPYHAPAKTEPLPPVTGVIDDPLPPVPDTPEPSTPEPRTVEMPVLNVPALPDDANPPDALDPEIVEPALVPPASSRPTPSIQTVRPPRSSSRQPASFGPVTAARPGNPGTATANHPGTARWNVSSKPAYPMALKAAGVHGAGRVQISTDGSGRVVAASMAPSTGNIQLDENTCRHARAFWTGPANATISVPITYQLH